MATPNIEGEVPAVAHCQKFPRFDALLFAPYNCTAKSRPGARRLAGRARPRLRMQARWTPTEDAGSLRFSQRYRDQAGEDYAAWAVTDLELSIWKLARLACSCLVLVVVAMAVRWLYCRPQVYLSDRTAAQLVAEDAKGAQEANRQKAAAAAAVSASVPTGPLDRFCRFCDMAIDEEHVQSHLQGKRHQKLKAAAGSLASDDCWVWRPAVEKAASVAAAAPAATKPELLAPRHDLLPALAKTGKVKGQTGKWAKVEKKNR